MSDTREKSTESPTGEAAVFASIVDWSAECPKWQRDALRRFCVTDKLTATDLEELIAICKGSATGTPVTADHVRAPTAGVSAVTLRSLSEVRHVNALAVGERLTFDKTGVTVIYGDNGSGKSGYARILKRVCRARSASKDERIKVSVVGHSPTRHSVPQRDFSRASSHWLSALTPTPIYPPHCFRSASIKFQTLVENL